jgi:hypothetical protein
LLVKSVFLLLYISATFIIKSDRGSPENEKFVTTTVSSLLLYEFSYLRKTFLVGSNKVLFLNRTSTRLRSYVVLRALPSVGPLFVRRKPRRASDTKESSNSKEFSKS